MPALAKDLDAVGAVPSSKLPSLSRSQLWLVKSPVDVDVKVTVSSVSGEDGDHEKDALGGAALANRGTARTKATTSKSTAARASRHPRRRNATPIVKTGIQSTLEDGLVKKLVPNWHRTFGQPAPREATGSGAALSSRTDTNSLRRDLCLQVDAAAKRAQFPGFSPGRCEAVPTHTVFCLRSGATYGPAHVAPPGRMRCI
jgi:hypothetical protein